jgi:hypothetical protein
MELSTWRLERYELAKKQYEDGLAIDSSIHTFNDGPGNILHGTILPADPNAKE